MNQPSDNPGAVAQHCAEFMLSGDEPARTFGFILRRAGPGEAQLEMTVPDNALNV